MKMKKLSEDHYIVMDDSEIKEGDFVYSSDGAIFKRHIDNPCQTVFPISKVAHSTQPIETFNWMGNSEKGYDTIKPLSLQEVKELLGVVDVEKSMWYERNLQNPYPSDSPSNTGFNKGFELGYNQALEDNKEKKYTEDDLKKAICIAKDSMGVDNDGETCYSHLSTEQIIQSLQPKTEWEVEIVDGKLKLKQ